MGICLEIAVEIIDSTTFATLVLKLCQDLLRVTLAIFDLAGQIDVADIKGPGIDVIINRSFRETDLIAMRREDMIDGLSFGYERCNEVVEFQQFFRRSPESPPGIPQESCILGMCAMSGIVSVIPAAGFFFWTACTDIRSPREKIAVD